jgi:uncharacterized protein YqjF (DUF2071 family)
MSSRIDRLSIRQRPEGQPLMHQAWGKLLFMHWKIAPELLRPLVPNQLTIDTYNDSAWIGVIPFTMWDIRPLPPYVPPIPGLNAMHELNVRTYVHFKGVPGVWFFSLDCTSEGAVLAARTFYYLPYYKAHIDLDESNGTINYESQRLEAPVANFLARWRTGEDLSTSDPDSLDYFLTERYCLYSEHKGEIYRARIFHQPWSLRTANVDFFESSMIESLGLPTPQGAPALHYAEKISVDIWKLEKV